MQAGDKITEIDGHSIHLWEEVSLNNLSRQTGDIVEVTYERDGKSNTVAFEARKLEGDSYAKVGIVQVVDSAYQQSRPSGVQVVILNLLNIGILLTANLGVMNLIPFPALDGGRLVFLLIEAIRGKRVPPEKEGMVHFAGFELLMIRMIFVMYNDIMRIF